MKTEKRDHREREREREQTLRETRERSGREERKKKRWREKEKEKRKKAIPSVLSATEIYNKKGTKERSNATYHLFVLFLSLKLMWLLKLLLDQNIIMIYHKFNGNFKSHINFKGDKKKTNG
jgi:hypothetical protein